jgi:hypothetical protein
MKKWFKALFSRKNIIHLFLNIVIIGATTCVMYIETVKTLLANRWLSKELTILVSAFVLLCAKEFLLHYWKKEVQVEIPVVETPVVETPVIETPVVETPVIPENQ